MIWLILKEILAIAFRPDKSDLLKSGRKKTFDQLLIVVGWTIVAFFLFNSIPHSIEVVMKYEHGYFSEVKATMMALAIEFIPAFAFMLGLHYKSLRGWRRNILMWMSLPFVLLTFHVQLSYYEGEKTITIWALELALILPYGTLVGTIAIAFLRGAFKEAADLFTKKVEEAVKVVEAKWRVVVEDHERKRSDLEGQVRQLQEHLSHTRALLEQPDPLRFIAEQELEATRRELAQEREARGRERLEANEQLDQAFSELEKVVVERDRLKAQLGKTMTVEMPRILSFEVDPQTGLNKITTEERRAQLAEMLTSGKELNQTELARQFGVTRQAIANDLRVLNR